MRVWRWPNVSADFYPSQSRPQFFNLAAFSPTAVGAGRFGNAGVGILQGTYEEARKHANRRFHAVNNGWLATNVPLVVLIISCLSPTLKDLRWNVRGLAEC